MGNSSKLTTFNSLSAEEQFFMLALHMPKGAFWMNCFDNTTNLGKLVKAHSIEYYRLGVLTEKFASDYDIRQTNELLIEWEKSVGIPQECFSTNRSLELRRINIEGLFSNFAGCQTNADYVRVGALYGYTIDVYSGWDVKDDLTTISFSTDKEAKNTVVINLSGVTSDVADFPLEIPYPFYGMGLKILDCMFRLLTPATNDIYVTTELN